MPEASMNNVTPSMMSNPLSNGYDTTLQERSSFTYPPSPINFAGRVSSSSDPSSLPFSDTTLNDHTSLHTHLRSIASGEKLVLISADTGGESTNISPSLSPKHRSTRSLSPRPTHSRRNSSSPTALKQIDPIEETVACKYRHNTLNG